MSRRGTSARTKVRSLAELEEIAFPDHPVSLVDLRGAAYAEKANEPVPAEVTDHLNSCEHCKRELAILRQTDPILTGEDDKRVKVLIEAADNRAVADRVEKNAERTLAAAVGSQGKALCSAAAALVGTLRDFERKSKAR